MDDVYCVAGLEVDVNISGGDGGCHEVVGEVKV